MSFVPVIRDYVEVVNTLSQNTGGFIQPIEFVRETAMYLFKTIQFGLVYLITLQWVHDFSLLPINIPQISISLFSENLFLDNPERSFLSFLEIPSIKQNSLFLGFFNSFFLTLPISIVHIITLRRLYIKGIPAATYSIAGYLIGQIFCIGCVLFGFRGIINSWFSFEPFNYIIGLILIFRVIYAMTQENLREIEGWNNPQYTNFFLTSFILAWCEQTSILQYIGNLSLNPNASLLEVSALLPTFSSSLQHIFYIVGLTVGSICFTIGWGFVFLFIKNNIIKYTPIFISSFVQQINRGTFVIAIALSLSSIPFYGLDYLLTGPLGFVSQDKIFKNTVFDQYNIKDSVVGLGISSQFDSVDIDVSPFDRGRYTLYPEKVFPFSFEDLNYRGEAEWTNRFDKVSTVTDSRAGFLSLSKILKKPNSNENNKVEQNINQNILPPISTFSSKIAPNADLGLEAKDTRFSDWYTLDQSLPSEEGPSIETTFSEGQDISFPLDFTRIASFEPGNIDLKIKQKYYSSQVYKNLLALDIDLFLNRQPNKFKLSPDNELDLFTKRRILTSYYDSLRDYSKLPYSANFENFFNGSKSFTNKVYNQQFKGTLRSVSRLFSLTSSDETSKLVLKFDQPLYKDNEYSAFHEELEPNKIVKINNFLNAPLYGGWDETSRRFVLTNKLLPKSNTETIIIPDKVKSSFTTMNSSASASKKIKFTTWPLTQEITNQGKTKSNIPFSTLYVPENEYDGTNDPAFEALSTLPLNWETMQRRSASAIGKTYENIFDYLAPQRGGFIWPGTSKFNIKFTNN
jgi:hypothetical protein